MVRGALKDYGPAEMIEDEENAAKYTTTSSPDEPDLFPEIGARGLVGGGGPTGWNGMTARQLETVEELNSDKVPKSSYKEASGPGARAAKFKESGGYIVIEKQGNCWEQCGRRKGWSGFCSYCSLSNGSPGFCCNPRSQGGCSAGMVKAVRGSSLRKWSFLVGFGLTSGGFRVSPWFPFGDRKMVK